MPYGYGASKNYGGSTAREKGADKNRTQSTSTKKSSPSKTTTTPNPQTDSGSSTTSVATSKQIKESKKQVNLATGKSQLDNYEVGKVPAFIPGSTILNAAQKLRQKSFEANRKFFQEKVLTSKNKGKYVDTLESYSSYMKARLAGTADAYGNPIAQRRDDRRIVTQVQKAAVAQATSGPTTSEVSQSTSAYGGELTEAQETLRVKKRGRRQTILTQPTGLGGSEPLISKKKLLG
jgi:hypothetical protein